MNVRNPFRNTAAWPDRWGRRETRPGGPWDTPQPTWQGSGYQDWLNKQQQEAARRLTVETGQC